MIKEETKERLLSAAKELILKYGYKRVTVDDICKEASVSKMTFYRAFDNKVHIAKILLEKVTYKGIRDFREIMHGNYSVEERMKLLIMLKTEGTNNISKEFLMDFYIDQGSEMSRFMIELTQKTWSDILAAFREAQAKGIFRADFKPELLMAFTKLTTLLFEDKELMALYKTPQEMIIEITKLTTYGVGPIK